MSDQIYDIIEQIKQIGSTLEKQRILESHKDNKLLQAVFNYTENRQFNYYLRANDTMPVGNQELTLTVLDYVCSHLHERKFTGTAARGFVNGILQTLTEKSQSVLTRVLNRDLDCKAGTAIINKVWNNMIPEMPCMLASKMDERAAASIVNGKDAYIVQRKCDGGRAMAVVSKNNGVTFLSRNGKPIEMHGTFDKMLGKFPGYVFDGELLVTNEFGHADRKTGNGFFTKAVRNTIKPEEAIKFTYVVWDMIPVDDFNAGFCSTPYNKRLARLIDVVEKLPCCWVDVVESRVVDSIRGVQKFYDEMIDRGEEGAIVKFANSPWENKRSKFMIKLKEEKDCDALVIGITPHTKKPEWIGSLTCQTRDGKVVFDVGSGFTEADRQRNPKDYLDKIVEVKYNSLITSKNKDTHSLFLPVFVKIRDDKKLANSFEELK